MNVDESTSILRQLRKCSGPAREGGSQRQERPENLFSGHGFLPGRPPLPAATARREHNETDARADSQTANFLLPGREIAVRV